jgi:hypothetical protein
VVLLAVLYFYLRASSTPVLDGIYVVHYTPLIARKSALVQNLAENGLVAQWVADEVAQGEMPLTFAPSGGDSANAKGAGETGAPLPQLYDQFRFARDAQLAREYGHGVYTSETLTRAELSSAAKHVEAYRRIAARNSSRPSIVLEDDAVLHNNFQEKIQAVLAAAAELEAGWISHDGDRSGDGDNAERPRWDFMCLEGQVAPMTSPLC